MAAAKLSSSEIKTRLDNIREIYQGYLRKIGLIRKQEKAILTDLMKKQEEEKIAEIRRSIIEK